MTGIPFIYADKAVLAVNSHDHIHISSAAQIPHILLEALAKRASKGELQDIHFHYSYSEGIALYADESCDGIFYDEAFFIDPYVKHAIKVDRADYLPVHRADTQ